MPNTPLDPHAELALALADKTMDPTTLPPEAFLAYLEKRQLLPETVATSEGPHLRPSKIFKKITDPEDREEMMKQLRDMYKGFSADEKFADEKAETIKHFAPFRVSSILIDR